MIPVAPSLFAAARYGNVLDYAGPNLTSSQLIVYSATGSHSGGPTTHGNSPTVNAPPLSGQATTAHQIAAALGSHDVVKLEGVNANLRHLAAGRNFNGPLFVATPQLLRAFGIDPSSVSSSTDIISMRPGLSSISKMALTIAGTKGPPIRTTQSSQNACPPSSCVANPSIVENSALPSGTSAPNTVITESAVRRYHLHETTVGWMIQAPSTITAAQISEARLAAASAGMSIETKNSQPTSSEIIGWATVFGVVLALGILAMTVGLIRSETAADLRTLTATGASSGTRRVLAAATAGALGLLGALIGTAVAYLAAAAWFKGNTLNGGISALLNAPGEELLIILIGMPLAAAAVGWLLAGKQPSAIAHQPME
jgi:putative ABC transport system permease protein